MYTQKIKLPPYRYSTTISLKTYAPPDIITSFVHYREKLNYHSASLLDDFQSWWPVPFEEETF